MNLSHPKEWLKRLLQRISAPCKVKAERKKQIWKLGRRWAIQNDALCRIYPPSGEVEKRIKRNDVTEIWLINMDTGSLLEKFRCYCELSDGSEIFIGNEMFTDAVRDWFRALEGFDDEKFIDCMGCTGYRRTLLLRRIPLAWLGSDAWVLTSLLLGKRQPIDLALLMGAADWLNHAILMSYEVNHALTLLIANGYLEIDADRNITITEKAETFKDQAFQKAKHFSKIEVVRRNLMQATTVPSLTVHEYFTDDDIKLAYEKYTEHIRKLEAKP